MINVIALISIRGCIDVNNADDDQIRTILPIRCPLAARSLIAVLEFW